MRLALLLGLLVLLGFGPARADEAPPFAYSMVEGHGGVPLLVMETGKPDGPELLLIHGMSQSHLAWMPVLRSDLAKTHRIVAFDLRGQGGSAKPWRPADYAGAQIWADDVAAVIAAKGLRKPVFVTWSFGGHVSLAYLRVYGQEHIGAIVMAGTLSGLVKPERRQGPEMDAIMAASKLRQSLDLAQNIEGYRQMPSGFTAQPAAPEFAATAYATGLMHPSYVRRAMTELPLDNIDLAAKIDVPVLIQVGSKDNEWPVELARKAAESLKRGKLSVYEGVGHTPFVEDTPRFLKELAAISAEASR